MIKKYLTTFAIHVQDSIAYRMRLFIWMLTDLVWIVVFPFVWLAVYGNQLMIGGYNKQAMVSYFFYMPLVNALLTYYTYPYMQYHIKEGRLSSFLTKPISYLLFASVGETAYRVWQATSVFVIMVIAYVFLHDAILISQFPENLIVIIPTFLLTMIVSAQCATLIGMIGFWTVQAEWTHHFWWMITTFATGYLAPITFYPLWAQHLLYYSPFPILMQVPIEAILGRLTTTDTLHWFVVGVVWSVVLFIGNILVWRVGVKRVDAIGL